MNVRKLLIFGVVIVAGLVSVAAFWSYLNSFQTITIDNDSEFVLSLYEATDSEGNGYDASSLVFKTSEPIKQKLKKGAYTYVVTGSSKYEPQAHRITLGDDPLTISIPQLDYTDKELAAQLLAEQAAANSVIKSKYPSQMELYTIQSGKLYKNGQWYGAKLVPNNPSANDTLFVVLKKSSSKWRIVTDPPEIVVSHPVYPDIPEDLLMDLNNFR